MIERASAGEYRYVPWFGECKGRKHEICQDKAICVQRNGVSVAVLSDGCSQSDISQIGAELTVKSISDLMVDSFDELYGTGDLIAREDVVAIKRKIVDSLIRRELEYVRSNPDVFRDYEKTHDSEIADRRCNGCQDPLLAALDATLLFFAEKDNKYMIGRIGDGMVGVVIGGRLKISLEEPKRGDRAGTWYPRNVYEGAARNASDADKWYHGGFDLKRFGNKKIEGVILTSDGVDSITTSVGDDNFRRRYTGVKTYFNNVACCDDGDRRKLLKEFLSKTREMCIVGDDCSVAMLVERGCKVSDYDVKEYEKPSLKSSASIFSEIENPDSENAVPSETFFEASSETHSEASPEISPEISYDSMPGGSETIQNSVSFCSLSPNDKNRISRIAAHEGIGEDLLIKKAEHLKSKGRAKSSSVKLSLSETRCEDVCIRALRRLFGPSLERME